VQRSTVGPAAGPVVQSSPLLFPAAVQDAPRRRPDVAVFAIISSVGAAAPGVIYAALD